MSDQDQEQARARRLELLEKIHLEADFDRRYYGWIAAHGGPPPAAPPSADEVAAAIAKLPLAFKYDRKEKFYGHRQKYGALELGINVIVRKGDVEAILVCRTPAGGIGWPFQMMARVVGQARDPAFEPVPRAPQLPFRSLAELDEALAFVVQLYEEIKDKVLARREQFE